MDIGISRVAAPRTRFPDSETWNFSTSHELIHILKNSTSLAEDILTIRTETGPLHGEMRVVNGNNYGYISLISNQPLFFCSKISCGSSICFTAVIDEREQIKATHYHNYSNNLLEVLDTILTGFSKEPNFRFFHLPRGVRIFIYHCEEHKILEALKHEGLELDPYRTKSNTILTTSDSVDIFRSIIQNKCILHKSNVSSPSDTDDSKHHNIHSAIAACFKDSQEQKPIPLKMIQRHELCKDLVAWGFKNAHQSQKLEDVIRELHTTRASLSQGCKESLGIGPMEVLKNIRLEYVHQALKNPRIQQKLDVKSVEEIRKYYGFKSRGNFAASYAKYFGEKPYTTMKRSSRKRTALLE